MKKQSVLFIIAFIAVAAAAILWWRNRPPTLAELQKRCLFVKTLPEAAAQAEKAKIIAQLEEHYLNLPVPDSLRRRVDREVAVMLDTAKINLAPYSNGVAPAPDLHQLEEELKNLLHAAAIARAREERENFQELMARARSLANKVDAGKDNVYWAPFVERFGAFTKAHAVNWLRAKSAYRHSWQNVDKKLSEAEYFSALGLKILRSVEDERIRLGLIYRLQYLLYYFHSLYDLASMLGQQAARRAEQIKNYYFSTSFVYLQAEALSDIGEYQAALPLYDTMLHKLAPHERIPALQWFRIHGLLGQGEAHLELGEFEKAIAACAAVEGYSLQAQDRIRLQLLRAGIYVATARYEQAEAELQKAIQLSAATRDTFNLISSHNTLGMMLERLTEHDLALDHYQQAKALFTETTPDISLRLIVLNNIADIFAGVEDAEQFNKVVEETKKLSRASNVPYQEMLLLNNIGFFYKRAGRYDQAMPYYEKAVRICDANGLLRFSLEAQIDIVECLIGLSRLEEAQSLAAKAMAVAEKIGDAERLIEATGRVAQIQHAAGNTVQARQSSNRLRNQIEALSCSFNNFERLTAYRQKVYGLLKNAAHYEIALHRPDSALLKLDYAKAYALKSRIAKVQTQQSSPAPQKYLDIDSVRAHLRNNSLAIDYLITEDTLFAFVLDQNGLRLLAKKLPRGAAGLQKDVEAYQKAIASTIAVFQRYEKKQALAHYDATMAIGQKLYAYLLGWPALASRLQQAEHLYVIPDEFLHGLPFATLPAQGTNGGTFLANHIAVSMLPSADFLYAGRGKGISKGGLSEKVVIAADQRFPGVTEFVAKVKALFPSAEELEIEDEAFSKSAVLAKLKNGYTIFIFVGHGSTNPKHPAQSYIELRVKAGSASQSQTGTDSRLIQLSLSDLAEIKWLGAEMVMLVGCETARGKLYRGAGMSGLLQGLISMGARNVWGNLWEVDASQVIPQAENFLALWAASRQPEQALQESQLNAIAALQRNDYYQQPHPYFWGSTVLLSAKPQ